MASNEPSKSHAVALLMEHRHALFAYVLACVRSHPDADDILQSVSVAVIEAEDPPRERDRFLAWAREIARRRVLEHYRTSRRVLPIDPQAVARLTEAAERADSRHAGPTRRDALLACLEKLPPESQQLLAARYDGSAEDTAALSRRFGRSEQGITSLLYRIRQALRDCVERRLRLEGA